MRPTAFVTYAHDSEKHKADYAVVMVSPGYKAPGDGLGSAANRDVHSEAALLRVISGQLNRVRPPCGELPVLPPLTDRTSERAMPLARPQAMPYRTDLSNGTPATLESHLIPVDYIDSSGTSAWASTADSVKKSSGMAVRCDGERSARSALPHGPTAGRVNAKFLTLIHIEPEESYPVEHLRRTVTDVADELAARLLTAFEREVG